MPSNSLALDGVNTPPNHIGGLENLDQEYDYFIDDIEGEIPEDLRGTFFRNGPGRQRIGKTAYGHWFDGDGMLCAFTFRDSKVHFKNAYVRTPKYVKETEQQQILYRGFGTKRPGGIRANFLKAPANPANTSAMYHGGKLLALNEGGRPWQLEPSDLTTIGEFNYDGGLSRGNVFSAHGKVHSQTGDYINFGAGISKVKWSGVQACLNVYRINKAGKLIKKGAVPLDSFPFCHDFALTENYAVFFIGSIIFKNMLKVLSGWKSISDQVTYDPKIPMKVVCVRLEDLSIAKEIQLDHGAFIHFGNAFEEHEDIIVDAMFQDDFSANATLVDVFNPEGRFGGGTYKRYTIPLSTGSVRENVVNDRESEFPTFNNEFTGIRQDYTYTACSIDNGANGFFNAFQKVNFDGNSELITLPQGFYGSEPLFAKKVNANQEDDGYLLNVVYDAFKHLSELQIYRAEEPTELACKLKLKHHLPHQFHGHFTDQVFC